MELNVQCYIIKLDFMTLTPFTAEKMVSERLIDLFGKLSTIWFSLIHSVANLLLSLSRARFENLLREQSTTSRRRVRRRKTGTCFRRVPVLRRYQFRVRHITRFDAVDVGGGGSAIQKGLRFAVQSPVVHFVQLNGDCQCRVAEPTPNGTP